MKTVTFVAGIAAGMAMTAAAMTAMYPDISRRVVRDSKKLWRDGKRKVSRMTDMLS